MSGTAAGFSEPVGSSPRKAIPMDTVFAKKGEAERCWYLVDAEDQVLGRLATRVSNLLRGKHKPLYTTHVDTGDHVIVINAAKVRVTGKKERGKLYYRHSGFPGGLKVETFERLLHRKPEAVIERAVKGMLPKNRLGRAMFRKLRVYADNRHPHAPQKPQRLEN